MGVVPWNCHICGREFQTIKGGLCGICNEPTCFTCFGYDENHPIRSIKDFSNSMCLACAKSKAECEKANIPWP